MRQQSCRPDIDEIDAALGEERRGRADDHRLRLA